MHSVEGNGRNVDLPQPLGPMMAVTAFETTSSDTLSRAPCLPPYHIDRFLTSNVRGGAASRFREDLQAALHALRTLGSGDAITLFPMTRIPRQLMSSRSARENSHQHINAKNSDDENKRAGPGLAMPVVVGRDGVGKNLQRKRGDRFQRDCGSRNDCQMQ